MSNITSDSIIIDSKVSTATSLMMSTDLASSTTKVVMKNVKCVVLKKDNYYSWEA